MGWGSMGLGGGNGAAVDVGHEEAGMGFEVGFLFLGPLGFGAIPAFLVAAEPDEGFVEGGGFELGEGLL